jgi:molecular chaperone GrpE
VNENEEKMSSQDPARAGEDSGALETDPAAALAAVTAERDQLAAEKAEAQDRYLRSQAEFQNLRKRVDRERFELFEYASTEAVRALLPVLDDFERALKVESTDKEYSNGIELIYQRFYEALKKLGLEPIVSKGQPFDPQIHHAVEMVETDEAPDHTVLDEFQRGYNFKGRLLRPAMVKVAVEPASK